MIIQDLRAALRSRKAATLSQLVAELGVEKDMVQSACDFWVRRGNVKVCGLEPAACGTACRRCPMGAAGPPAEAAPKGVVYEWLENRSA